MTDERTMQSMLEDAGIPTEGLIFTDVGIDLANDPDVEIVVEDGVATGRDDPEDS